MRKSRTVREIKWVADLPPSEARDKYLELLVAEHIQRQTDGGLAARAAREMWYALADIWEGIKAVVIGVPVSTYRKLRARRSGRPNPP